MINETNATHLFCGRHYCIKTLEAHGVKYDFNDDVTVEELRELQATYTGKHFAILPEIRPTNLNGYHVYQGELL